MKWIKTLALAASLACSCAAWAETGVEPGLVRFGSTMDMTGPNGASVAEVISGMKMAFQEANDGGGVNGRKLDIVFDDDVFVKEKAVANMRSLDRDQKVFALIGGTGSGVVPTMMPVLTELKLPMVGAYAGGVGSMREQANRYYFNTRGSYDDEAQAIVDHFTQFGLNEFVVVYSDDGFGKSVLASFERAAKAKNAKIIAQQPIGADYNGAPAIEALANVRGNTPIIFGGSPKHAAGFLPGFRKAHANSVYAISTIGNIYKTLGEPSVGMIVSQTMPAVLDTGVPIVARYQASVAKYKKGAGLELSMPGLEGYVQASIAIEALRKAGANPTRESFVDALESFRMADLGGFYVTYDKGRVHLGTKFVELTMVGANGAMIF